MKMLLVVAGAVAWGGVMALALAMAELGEPVWGFFPIAAGVIVAWMTGEFLTERYLTEEQG